LVAPVFPREELEYYEPGQGNDAHHKLGLDLHIFRSSKRVLVAHDSHHHR
jgi:hypothetical protein